MNLFQKHKILFICLFVCILIAVFIVYLYLTLPNPGDLAKRKVIESTKIYDRTGEVVLYEIFNQEKRTIIPWEEIPESVKKTTLAAEDKNFYERHLAVDLKGLARAILHNIIHPQDLQGASTIAQQLARNAFLTREKNIIRKIKELILAIRIESTYTKDQILDLYLNQVPYGSSAYGIEAASELYFNKPAKDLTWAEAAYLAALLKSPSTLSPYGSHIDKLKDRQQWILNRLVELNWVDKEIIEKAKNEKVIFAPPSFGLKAPHFAMYIKEQLAEQFGEEIDSLGLKVITTLDMRLQTIAEEAVKKNADLNIKRVNAKNMAFLAQDPQTGQILAMVGSRDYFDIENEGNFNVTLATRQPGSSFKPFAYITAFRKGYNPNTVVYDLETNFSNDPNNPYIPPNYDKKFRGPVTFRQALAQSLNVPSVKVLYLAGLKDTIKTAQDFGITTLNQPPEYYGLPLVLGGGGVRLIDMVQGYSVFSQEGILHPQVNILKIIDSKGNILYQYEPKEQRVIEPEYTQIINDILSDNEARAPAFGYNSPLVIPGYQVAVKTGSSNDYRDAWTIGYTPTLVAGVWVGNNDYSPVQKEGAGVMVAAPCWHDFMTEALKIIGSHDFNPPPIIENNKPMFNGSYQVNRTFKIDRLTGQPVNGFTPQDRITEITFKEIHSILYYVDRNNPLGPIPKNPSSDPQFLNWEIPVLAWAQTNIPNFNSEYNKPIPEYLLETEEINSQKPDNSSSSDLVQINILSPSNGALINNNFVLEAQAVNLKDNKLLAYLNNESLGEMTLNENGNYVFYISLDRLQPQNEIRVEARDQNNNLLTQSQIIVFKP